MNKEPKVKLLAELRAEIEAYITDQMYTAQVASVKALDVLEKIGVKDEEMRQMLSRIVDMAQDVTNRIKGRQPHETTKG